MIHFVTIMDFLTATLKKKCIRVKQKNPNVMPRTMRCKKDNVIP